MFILISQTQMSMQTEYATQSKTNKSCIEQNNRNKASQELTFMTNLNSS